MTASGTVSAWRAVMRRRLGAVLYLSIARHLPWSILPFGQSARRLRGALAALMLDECGDDVNVEHGAWFGSGAGVHLGDRSGLGLDALIMGPVFIGSDVMMGPRCLLVSSTHSSRKAGVPMRSQGFEEDRPIRIADDVWIGGNVTILPGVSIGSSSIIAAGAVVTRDVPPYAVSAGNPARVVKYRNRLGSSDE